MWGQHLIVDMAGCDARAMRDRDAIARFSRDLVAAVGMKTWGAPRIEHFAAHAPDAAGYTLVQLIETSSVTAHFAEARAEIYLDLFSCKRFSEDAALAACRRHFRPRRWSVATLLREAGKAPVIATRIPPTGAGLPP